MADREVEALRSPGRHADGGGLYFQVESENNRFWLFRYMRHGRSHDMGLGPFNDLTLAEAREKARKARQQLLDGIDPLQARRAAKTAEQAQAVTFKADRGEGLEHTR